MEKEYLPFEIEKGLGKNDTERVALLRDIYSNLSEWQTVQVARHPERPLFRDYLGRMILDFEEMHGDGLYGDDRVLIGGLGKIGREHFMIIGYNKGRASDLEKMRGDDMDEKMRLIAGCPNPEGFRKANRLMRFAEKFNLPILTFIDTPGAYPGIGAEERGQAEAIAQNLKYMSRVKVPITSILIGEGGSGGALGIGVANKLAALENTVYSVISPEGCAAILWHDGSKKEEAAEALQLSARNGYKFGAIDDIISEPAGGAHTNYEGTFANVGKYILDTFDEMKGMKPGELVQQRYEAIGRRASGEKRD